MSSVLFLIILGSYIFVLSFDKITISDVSKNVICENYSNPNFKTCYLNVSFKVSSILPINDDFYLKICPNFYSIKTEKQGEIYYGKIFIGNTNQTKNENSVLKVIGQMIVNVYLKKICELSQLYPIRSWFLLKICLKFQNLSIFSTKIFLVPLNYVRCRTS